MYVYMYVHTKASEVKTGKESTSTINSAPIHHHQAPATYHPGLDRMQIIKIVPRPFPRDDFAPKEERTSLIYTRYKRIGFYRRGPKPVP